MGQINRGIGRCPSGGDTSAEPAATGPSARVGRRWLLVPAHGRADTAMYCAKKRSRNTYQFFDRLMDLPAA